MNHHASRFIWLKSVLIGLAGLLTVLAASGPPTLALPPLIIGLILLWFSQLEAIQANSRLHQASVMISVWGLILGIGLFVTNAGITLWAQSRGRPAAMIRKSQQSSRSDLYVTGPANKLGFNYTPSQTVVARRWREVGNSKHLVYSATYTIDAAGNRKTCLSSQSQSAEHSPTVLFIGDSFTMGEGLEDCETLPSLFARVSGLHATNAATNGYGTHQALKLLEDDQLLHARIGNRKIRLVVYRMIKEHLHRLSGRSPWDAFGPCYQQDQITQQLHFKGPFSRCIGISKVSTLLAWTAADELLKSNEPLTYRLGATIGNIAFQDLKRPIDDKTMRLFVAMMARMQYHAARHGASLIVIFDDNDPDCQPGIISERLASAFEQLQLPVILGSQLMSQNDCRSSRFTIPGDGHPNREYNLLLARDLLTRFVKASRTM